MAEDVKEPATEGVAANETSEQKPTQEEVKPENDTQQPKEGSILGGEEKPSDKITESAPVTETDSKDDYEFDKRLYNEDGTFNKEGAKEFLSEIKKERENYEDRILNMRRKISDNKAIEDKNKIFQDFAPKDERFFKYFQEDTPEETKELMSNVQEVLADTYYDAGLSQRQADDVTNAVLNSMEKIGILDTRTKDEKYIERQEWIEKQKSALGGNADNIIRTTKNFVENTNMFDPATKNQLLEMMESVGAPVINALYQVQEGAQGEMPVNVAGLGSLEDDYTLAKMVKEADSPQEREAIYKRRAAAGRTGPLPII